MKRWMIALVVCIPLASVMFGGVMAYFALTSNDTDVLEQAKPLSKMSWREAASDGSEVRP